MRIKDKRDLRIAYDCLKALYDWIKEKGECTEGVQKYIRESKKDIREYYKLQDEELRITYIDSDYDSAILLYELGVPSDWDYNEVDEYFKEFEYMRCQPSQYDCTGQRFTGWYKIFKRNDKWMTYHRVCLDV